MKKIWYTLFLLFIFTFSVSAEEISPAKIAGVINNGDITTAFKETYDNCELSINASGSSNIIVTYSATCKEQVRGDEVIKNYGHTFELVYDSAKNQLAGEVKVPKKEIGQDILLPEVMKLVPYWTVEASNKYDQIKKKNGKNNINRKLGEIFDKCYLDEYGVCYGEMPEYGDKIYYAKVKLDDTAANHALKIFKEEEEDNNQKNVTKMLILVAVGLLLLMVLFKSLTPGKEKY